MTAAAQALYDSLTADMVAASANMAANLANYTAYRNAQAAHREAETARAELLHASDPEAAAQANRAHDEALASDEFYHQ